MTYFKEYFSELVSPAWQWDLVGLNLVMIIGFLFVFKYTLAALTNVSIREELAEKDNPAFGITIGFSFLSFFLIMGAASTGDDVVPLMQEAGLMFGYGFAGMIMLFVSKIVFDNVAMRSFCIQKEIRKRNISAALVDGTNMLATSIMVYTYMSWVKGTSFESLSMVAFGWIASQILLTGMSFLRSAMFKSKNGSLHEAIQKNNIAVAIRYSSYKVAFGFTALTASSHYPYEIGGEDNLWNAFAIVLSSVILVTLIKILANISKYIVLSKIDFADEINEQRNYGLAVIEAFFVLGITIAVFSMLR